MNSKDRWQIGCILSSVCRTCSQVSYCCRCCCCCCCCDVLHCRLTEVGRVSRRQRRRRRSGGGGGGVDVRNPVNVDCQSFSDLTIPHQPVSGPRRDRCRLLHVVVSATSQAVASSRPTMSRRVGRRPPDSRWLPVMVVRLYQYLPRCDRLMMTLFRTVDGRRVVESANSRSSARLSHMRRFWRLGVNHICSVVSVTFYVSRSYRYASLHIYCNVVSYLVAACRRHLWSHLSAVCTDNYQLRCNRLQCCYCAEHSEHCWIPSAAHEFHD